MNDDQFQQLMELTSATYIQLCRIYDLLLVSGDKQGIDTIAIKEMHELGKTFSPYPSLVEDDE
jgi:hypothetical protein